MSSCSNNNNKFKVTAAKRYRVCVLVRDNYSNNNNSNIQAIIATTTTTVDGKYANHCVKVLVRMPVGVFALLDLCAYVCVCD